MTSSTSKITLPGLSFCAYQDSPQVDVAKFEQAFIANRVISESGVAQDVLGILVDLQPRLDLRKPTMAPIKEELTRSLHQCSRSTPAHQTNSRPDTTPLPSTQPEFEREVLRTLKKELKELMHKRPSPFSDVS